MADFGPFEVSSRMCPDDCRAKNGKLTPNFSRCCAGNGIRCLARFVASEDKAAPRSYKCGVWPSQPRHCQCPRQQQRHPDRHPPVLPRVGTLGGVMIPEVRADGQVAVDMGEPIFEPAKARSSRARKIPTRARTHPPLPSRPWPRITALLPPLQVPTTLAATKDGRVVQQKMTVRRQGRSLSTPQTDSLCCALRPLLRPPDPARL